MTSDVLLIRHQRKLSVYFALFVLCSLWLAQGAYMLSYYITQNVRLINKMETRIDGIRNILSNKQDYQQKLNANDETLRLVIEKSLQGVTVYENDARILGNLDAASFSGTSDVIYSSDMMYYQSVFSSGSQDFHIIIENENEYSHLRFLREYGWFLLFTFPFSILFYFIGSFFVGKNLRPIDETIQSLEDFSSNLNHEIKTPLAEIISTLSLTKRTKTDYDEAIDQSLRSASKITAIIDSMKGLIRLVDVSYKKERTDLSIALREIVEDFIPQMREKQLELNMKFASEAFVLKVNRAHLELCVGNIMKNAIKYSAPNGQIYVSFETGKLIIRDFGVGISEENLAHVFDRYFRENYLSQEGYGLGLALVKKIVDLNKWKISITSQKDLGTTVTLQFV